MNQPVDHSRRAFLGLRQKSVRAGAVRPPWSTTASLAEHCTRCGDCIAACPEKILRIDGDGLPQVDFAAGACTFCGDCATACAAPVFDRALNPAWNLRVAISDQCLPRRGILCESCRDVCIDGAISFVRASGRAPVPAISAADCTGCGACVSICPAAAITATVAEEVAHA